MRPETPDLAPAPSGPRWRGIVGTLAGVFLGLVFLVAVYGKVFDPQAFAEAIRADGLDFLIPSEPLAWIMLAVEAAIGLALVLNLRRLWVLVPTALLVAFFLFLTGKVYVAWLNGEDPAMASCGCFGSLVDHDPGEAFWRDVVLLLPASILAFLGRPRGMRFPWARSLVVVVFAGAVGVFAWQAPGLDLDDFATRLKPGVRADEVCVGSGEDEVCLTSPAVEPLLAEGSHLVVIAELDDEAFAQLAIDRTEELFVRMGEPEQPQVLVLHPGKKEDEAQFQFLSQGAPLEFKAAPRELLRPLYRSLPRTFLLVDGRVLRTWPGFPPLAELRPE
jgi:uncharacterized membrane protein YphA (DoxX/SURF4 family)